MKKYDACSKRCTTLFSSMYFAVVLSEFCIGYIRVDAHLSLAEFYMISYKLAL